MPTSESGEPIDAWLIARDVFKEPKIPTRHRVSEAARRDPDKKSASQYRRYFKAFELAERHSISGPMSSSEWKGIQEDAEYDEQITRSSVERAGGLLRPPSTPIASDFRAVWDMHVGRLMNMAQEIRELVYDPHWEVEAYVGPTEPHSLLHYGRGDWVLMPTGWVERVTPDFEDVALWGDLFPSFQEHSASSPFWSHRRELDETAPRLEADVTEACVRLAREEPTFAPCWEKWHGRTLWDLKVTVNPAFGRSDSEDDAPPYARHFSTEAVCAALMDRFMPDLRERTGELWQLLQQCRDDLMPERIGPVLTAARCDLCTAWSAPSGGAATAAGPPR